MIRDMMLRAQERRWRDEIKRLHNVLSRVKAQLETAEIRHEYYHSQVQALSSVAHLEAAE